jgi:uncharacterized membrane protein YbhN (UPF0104 family)
MDVVAPSQPARLETSAIVRGAPVAACVVDAVIAAPLQRRWPRRRLVGGAVSVVVLALVAVALPIADEDSFLDLLRSVKSTVHGFGALRWQFMPILVAVAALHYLCAALALQAAAGERLPLGRTMLAELAASTANRLTPAGLGGAAVNVRYLTLSGATTATAAGGIVIALAIVGALADLVLLVFLVVAGGIVGLGGGRAALAALRSRVVHLTGPSAIRIVLAGVIVAGVVLAVRRIVSRRRRSFGDEATASALRNLGRLAVSNARHVADVARRPRDLATLVTASGATTVLMGLGLAVAVHAVPGPTPGSHVGLIVSAYMVGAAVGSAVPTPAGVGSAEASLVGALVVVNVPVAHALQSVLLFRLAVFWSPAVVGLPAARMLRQRGSL